MDTKKLTCINCPMGCSLEVEIEEGKYKVTGNSCKRGVDYAVSELTNPRRILTTSLLVRNGIYPTVSVKTSGEVPKNLLFSCVKELAKVQVDAPVRIGDVIIKNIKGTGVDIVATRGVEERQ